MDAVREMNHRIRRDKIPDIEAVVSRICRPGLHLGRRVEWRSVDGEFVSLNHQAALQIFRER
jgi:hypothetical protein